MDLPSKQNMELSTKIPNKKKEYEEKNEHG